MGVFIVLISLLCFLMTSDYSVISSSVGSESGGDIASSSNPPPPPVLDQRSNKSPFKPSIAVIVGVLTTMFSITFLLLLYVKHCKRGNGYANGTNNSRGVVSSAARKNSGIDRTVIESLPVFRFGSLRGQKDGLECAVCLNRFEPTEVLRLLPKCNHAFHVECVDTWLDAHSTCPLCRYRVDPEDILLVEDNKVLHEKDHVPLPPAPPTPEEEEIGIRRVSGRHSSAGERGSMEKPSSCFRPVESSGTSRRSLDSHSWSKFKKENEGVSIGCFERPRKDGLLLTEGSVAERTSFERRFEHRIIVSAGSSGNRFHNRWSDVHRSDLMYLRSEMIISDSRRFSGSSGSRPSVSSRHHIQSSRVGMIIDDGNNGWWQRQNGRSVINSRSVSEITGLSRFANWTSNDHHLQQRQQQRQAGVVSRWLAWISESRSQEPGPGVLRSGRPSIAL